MEGLLIFHYENHFLYISGIHHVESRTSIGFFRRSSIPATDTWCIATAETAAQVNRLRLFIHAAARRLLRYSSRFDAGSVPVGYLVLSSGSKSALQET